MSVVDMVVVVVVSVARPVVMVTIYVSASRMRRRLVAIVTSVGVVVRLLVVVPADVIVDDIMISAVLVCRHVVLMLQWEVDVTRVVAVFRHHRYTTDMSRYVTNMGAAKDHPQAVITSEARDI